jgi:hypothetical protein
VGRVLSSPPVRLGGEEALPHFGPAFVRKTSDACPNVKKIGTGCEKREAEKVKSGTVRPAMCREMRSQRYRLQGSHFHVTEEVRNEQDKGYQGP